MAGICDCHNLTIGIFAPVDYKIVNKKQIKGSLGKLYDEFYVHKGKRWIS